MRISSHKRRRLVRSLSPQEPDDTLSYHIFAAPTSTTTSTSQHSPTDHLLWPCSYEISLNSDLELLRSLQIPRSSSSSSSSSASASCSASREGDCGTQLVTWTCASGDRSIVTDRYDAIHLLNSLPPHPPPFTTKHRQPYVHRIRNESDQEMGWSDLESDTEDMFYMTENEASDFLHSRAKARLEAQHTFRSKALGSRDSPSVWCSALDDQVVVGSALVEREEKMEGQSKVEERKKVVLLEQSQFELMQKTARILAKSNNASMLEMQILANHGGDERFKFLLRKNNDIGNNDCGGKDENDYGVIWEALKKSRGELGYVEAVKLLEQSEFQDGLMKKTWMTMTKVKGDSLVEYDDSDDNDSDQSSCCTSKQQK
ncbi:uncharacterized protein MEPE_02427 [Melanopsichium pennsylvanicum]|uniref:Uncharacterized protein n=1 Tax=Melanopsichium pennsylvanicum TaxID=63383 RepID=A0AAJ4XJK8_9BASI|nr:uncharacterized protein MEPE_02427 [Melanopsichium pennsylvanicum]